MVYGIIREHSGSVEVQSDPGKGSVFKIILPMKTVEKAREDRKVPWRA